MSDAAVFDSPRAQQVVAEYYPEALREADARHKAYEEELRVYAQAAEVAAVAVLREIVDPLARQHSPRFFCRLDRENLTKSPSSVDDKIVRYLSGAGVAGKGPTEAILRRLRVNRQNPAYFLTLFFRELPDVMNDLARFRIVANFLVDVQSVAEAFGGDRLSRHGLHVEPGIEDRIEADRWEEGAGGHRAIHVYLNVPVGDRQIRVEVQIISVLELGWDLKAHLLYELKRRGEDGRIDKRTKLKVRAVSDALYVADVLLDELYQKVFGGDQAS